MSEGNGKKDTESQGGRRSENGQFLVGNKAAVGHGRPRGNIIMDAVERVQRTKKRAFVDHAVEQAYKDNRLIPVILDRIEPKLVSDDERAATPVVINIVNFVAGAIPVEPAS